jgi:hypothetical protein
VGTAGLVNLAGRLRSRSARRAGRWRNAKPRGEPGRPRPRPVREDDPPAQGDGRTHDTRRAAAKRCAEGAWGRRNRRRQGFRGTFLGPTVRAGPRSSARRAGSCAGKAEPEPAQAVRPVDPRARSPGLAPHASSNGRLRRRAGGSARRGRGGRNGFELPAGTPGDPATARACEADVLARRESGRDARKAAKPCGPPGEPGAGRGAGWCRPRARGMASAKEGSRPFPVPPGQAPPCLHGRSRAEGTHVALSREDRSPARAAAPAGRGAGGTEHRAGAIAEARKALQRVPATPGSGLTNPRLR